MISSNVQPFWQQNTIRRFPSFGLCFTFTVMLGVRSLCPGAVQHA